MFLESICSSALLKVVVGTVTREAGTSDHLFHDFLALLKTPGKQNPTALLFTSTYTQLYHLVWSTSKRQTQFPIGTSSKVCFKCHPLF
jgi:hypothetical protein